MVEQEYKVIDPRQAPPENPKNMPKSYKKPVFNNELMKPAYQQRAPLPADVRDAQGLMLPEEPAPSNPTLYSVPTDPDVQTIKQGATENRQKMEQDLNNANTQQQQMFGTPPSAAPVAPSTAPPLPTGAPPAPPEFKPSGALKLPLFASLTEKKTLKSGAPSGLVYHLELLEEEQEWPVPLPIPMPATEEPEWEPPIGMGGSEEGGSPPRVRTATPEGTGIAAPLPPLPKSDAPNIVKQEETLPWQPAPPPVAASEPPFAPSTDMPKPLANRIPQPSADPFSPALSTRTPDVIPPPQAPQMQEAAALPIKPPGVESQIEGAIKMKPEGYVAKDNNPEPRDHLYEYIGLTGVPLQDTPDPRGFIDGPDEEVFGYIPPPKDTTFKSEPTHEFGTPEIPEGAGHSNVTAMNEVGYATDDPDLFSEEPFLLNPFKYDNRPKVNHPDFTPKEIAKPRPKRREAGSRFAPAYRHEQPTIGGPENSSYYGYSYFQNVYNAE